MLYHYMYGILHLQCGLTLSFLPNVTSNIFCMKPLFYALVFSGVYAFMGNLKLPSNREHNILLT